MYVLNTTDPLIGWSYTLTEEMYDKLPAWKKPYYSKL